MLSKFKSKLFSARGVFGGGDEEEEKDTPIVKNDRDEVGEIGSHEPQTTTSDKGDTLKWYAERIVFHLVQIRLKMPAFCCMCVCVCVCVCAYEIISYYSIICGSVGGCAEWTNTPSNSENTEDH